MRMKQWRLRAAIPGVALLCCWVTVAAAAQFTAPQEFARTDQTVEYHFLLVAPPDLSEAQVAKGLPRSFLDRFAPLVEIEASAKPRPGMYVDSPDRILMKQNLILRVREGLITFKARGLSPEVVLDLEKCSTKKYEMDFFGQPEYSVSSDIRFKKEEFDVALPGLTLEKLSAFMDAKCPAASAHFRPALQGNPAVKIPGAATMYGFDARLNRPQGGKALEAGLSVWFFPPTNEKLFELAFTGYVRDRAEFDALYAELLGFLKERGLLHSEQISKTDYYFKAFYRP